MIKQKRRIVIFHEEKCLNCGACELACSVSHSESRDLETAVRNNETPKRRRWMKSISSIRLSIGCQHCTPAPCVDACMSAAMKKGPGHETIHDSDKCVGCWMCVMVCPFGAIKRLPEEHHIVKCDLCDMDEHLFCVNACPTNALEIHIIEND